MNGLALFAETPRAGELGHRFLVPFNLSVSESEVAEFVQVADSDLSVGENFVAIGAARFPSAAPQAQFEKAVRSWSWRASM